MKFEPTHKLEDFINKAGKCYRKGGKVQLIKVIPANSNPPEEDVLTFYNCEKSSKAFTLYSKPFKKDRYCLMKKDGTHTVLDEKQADLMEPILDGSRKMTSIENTEEWQITEGQIWTSKVGTVRVQGFPYIRHLQLSYQLAASGGTQWVTSSQPMTFKAFFTSMKKLGGMRYD